MTLALTALLLAAPALADDATKSAVTGDEVKVMLVAKGHTVDLTTDSVGDPLINARTSDGWGYQVLFYNCNAGACGSVQFRRWWAAEGKIAPGVLDAYEVKRRIGRCYLDADKDPTIELNVWLDGGVSITWLSKMHDRFLMGAQELYSGYLKDKLP